MNVSVHTVNNLFNTNLAYVHVYEWAFIPLCMCIFTEPVASPVVAPYCAVPEPCSSPADE